MGLQCDSQSSWKSEEVNVGNPGVFETIETERKFERIVIIDVQFFSSFCTGEPQST